jgi:hypothetical protein
MIKDIKKIDINIIDIIEMDIIQLAIDYQVELDKNKDLYLKKQIETCLKILEIIKSRRKDKKINFHK